MAATTTSHCPTCAEPGMLICSGCKNVKYCSAECQQAGWPSHKVLCSSFKNFQQRPVENMRRIIYFPPKGKKAEFMWRPLKSEGSGKSSETVDMADLMGDGNIEATAIQSHGTTGKPLGYTLHLHFDNNSFTRPKTPNKAVTAAAGGKLMVEWEGPLYAECGDGQSGLTIVKMNDMDMRTFADLVAWLQWYNNDDDEHKIRRGPKVEAVKMTCIGERRLRGGDVCQKVMVPANHPAVASTAGLSEISKRIGMPIYTIKYPMDSRFSEIHDVENQPATFMNLGLNPHSEFSPRKGTTSFGWAPMQWQNEVGNVLLIRQDREPLEPEVAEAFGAYCQYHLGEYAQWQLEAEAEYGTEGDMRFKDHMLAEVTPEKWATYLQQWRHVKQNEKEEDTDDCYPGGWGDADSVEEELIDGVARMAVTKKDAGRVSWRLFSFDNPFWADIGVGRPE